MGIQSILNNRVRSLLSMLGILIGVAAVIAMLAIGNGAQESIKEEFSNLGTGTLTIHSGAARFGPGRTDGNKLTRFEAKDTEKILQGNSFLASASSFVSGSTRAIYKNKNWETSLYGVDMAYKNVERVEVKLGRFFTKDESLSRSRIALIGQTVQEELFGSENPIGKSIKVGGSRFQIIGLLAEKGSSGFRDEDDIILVPLDTAMKRVLGVKYLSSIRVKVKDGENIDNAEEALNTYIKKYKRVAEDDTFNIRNMASFQEALSGTIQVMSVLLAAIAAISLFVGGIGIMNIMLVSVTERTKEIGLRKAIGASKEVIMLQFLIESILVSISGGLIGIILGVLVSKVVSLWFGWSTSISVSSVILASVFSVFIGVLFGLWPAKKAADLEPIDALRYD